MAGGYVTPDGDAVDQLVRELGDLRSRVRELEKPTGTQSASTVKYLAGLITVSASGTTTNTGSDPGDAVRRWIDTSPITQVTFAATTGRILITATCGEISLEPGDGYAVGYVSFEVSTPSGVLLAEGTRSGRLYNTADGRLGVSAQVVYPMSVPKDEPITVRLKLGIWSVTTSDPAECTFQSPALVVQVIDPG